MRTRTRVGLMVLAYLGFVSLGLPDGLLGTAWPALRAELGLPVDALGALLVATTAGYVASSFASGASMARLGVGALLGASTLATAASLLGYAATPAFAAMIALAVLAGLGAGAIDAGLNTWVATRHPARTLHWLHACYGVGAAAGPALLAHLLETGRSWRVGYALAGGAQLALAVCFLASRGAWSGAPAGPEPAPAAPTPTRATLRLPATWLGMATFLLYVGAEASAGAWLFSVLHEARGASMMHAGSSVSAYWAALAAGRILFGAFAARLSPVALLRGCLASFAAGAALLASGAGTPADAAAVALLGLAAGPVFPTLIAATPMRLGGAHAANGVGFQVAAAALGQSLVPAGAGLLAARAGLEAIPLALLALAVAVFAAHEALLAAVRYGRPPAAPGAEPDAEGAPWTPASS
jgi:fucose permease